MYLNLLLNHIISNTSIYSLMVWGQNKLFFLLEGITSIQNGRKDLHFSTKKKTLSS